MRPRTRRLKSLLVGMGGSFGQATGDPPPSDDARGVPKAQSRRIRECAPLCLTRALAGAGPMRLGADLGASLIVHHRTGGGKSEKAGSVHAHVTGRFRGGTKRKDG